MLDKTFVAIDNYSAPMAEKIMEKWKDKVAGFRLNHDLYEKVDKTGYNILCDYKLFDNPNTMNTIIEKLIDDGTQYVTVHVSNSYGNLKELSKYNDKINILGVSYLTSWDEDDVASIYRKTIRELWKSSIQKMEDFGFYGAICSPSDLNYFKETKLKKICPGIRYTKNFLLNKKRVATPEEAIRNGADYLVIDRSFFNTTR